jgi:thiol-disulfide isomerase/thioredoxin
MKPRFSHRAGLAAAAAGLLLAASCGPVNLEEPESKAPVPAPNFNLSDLQGRAVQLTDFKGKVVLLDFWATWCAPCRSEMPMLQALHNQFRDRGFEVVGISVDEVDPEQVVPAYVKKAGFNYTQLLSDEKVQESYGPIRGIPTFLLIDREGKIRRRGTGGGYPREAFEKWILELL